MSDQLSQETQENSSNAGAQESSQQSKILDMIKNNQIPSANDQTLVAEPDQEAEKKAITPDATWTCESIKQQKELTELQVGDLFKIKCNGEGLSESLNKPLKIIFAEEKDNHSLKVIDTEVAEFNNVQLVVTGYRAGPFKHSFFITDGQKNIQVDGLNWQITSVLPKNQPPPPPFGGILVGLSYPLWMWITLAIVVSVIIGLFVRSVQKVRQRRQLMSRLREYSTALSPFNQFNKDLRLILRKVSYAGTSDEYSIEQALTEIDNEFKLYLVRELKVPAIEWTIRQVISELKSRHRKIFDQAGLDIRNTLYELRGALRSSKDISWSDCEQLAKMTRNAASKVNKVKKGLSA